MFPSLNWVTAASTSSRASSPAFIQHPDSEFRTPSEPRANTPTPTLGSVMREARENPRARTTSTTTNTSSAVLDLDWSLVGPASGSEQPASSLPRRHRASLLGAASGALAGRLSRRKARANTRPPSPTKEAAVRAADAEEAEERNRLRDAAAQSLGLELGLPAPGRLSSEKEHEGEEGDDEQGTEVRIQAPVTPTLSAFPATKASLVPLVVMQTALPKHYPPPSLFKRALAHQWKTRTVVLTGPPTTSRTGGGAPSHLHVFRIGSGSERELERLAIDERSVVFVADEDVSGRAHVVKVGGHDVGARRRELNGEESGMTMMWLQIVDAQESRAWIGAIKAAVLGQRSVRAGLGNSYGASPSEPRGDLDVVLSMRMQGMGARPAPSESSQSQTSSTSSTRPNSPRPTISFKGLFGNSRPRSLSRATSIASTDDSHPVSPTADSFASVANSIMAHETPYARRIVHNRTSVDLDYEDALSTRAMSPPPLGPPPNRRRTHTSSAPEPLERDGRIYTFGNTSFGDARALTPVEDSPSLTPVLHTPPIPLPQSPTEPNKQRANSVSSVSTLGGASDRRRWSRQSALATLSAKSASPPQRHPYAAVDGQPQQQSQAPVRSSSRASTSTTSHRTIPGILALKRASVSSAASASLSNESSSLSHSFNPHSHQPTASGSGASTYSYPYSGTGSLLSPTGTTRNRQSMPPPQRPAPNTALPPTPSDPPRPELRPRSMSARPGTAPGAVSASGSFSLIGAPSASQAVAQVKAGSKLRLSLHGKTPPTAASAVSGHDKPHRRTTSSGADVPCARPPPSGPLPPPPSESKRGSLPPESKRGSWHFEPKRGSLTMTEHRQNTSSERHARRSSLDAKRGLGMATLEAPPAPPDSPTIASSIVQRLRMFGSGGSSTSAVPSRATTPSPSDPTAESANEPSPKREVDLSSGYDTPIIIRQPHDGPMESEFMRGIDSNGGPILLAPNLLRALDGDPAMAPSLVRQRVDSQALPMHPPPPRVADLQRSEGSDTSRPGSPGVAERITDPRVALAEEAAADAERERMEREQAEREHELESMGLDFASGGESVPSSPTGAPARPPRSARRPPPRTHTPGSGSDTGPITALAPPPRRRPATAAGIETRGGEGDADDASGRMLRLPEDARSDLGRANVSRLSLLLADAGP